MFKSFRNDLLQGEEPVKTANTLIGVEIRSFDQCSDARATAEEILNDKDRLTQYYPYLSDRLVQDLIVPMFFLMDQALKNEDLRLTVCAVNRIGGNGSYKGTRFQIESFPHKQALILDFFDISVVRIVDKHWLYSDLFPKKTDDPASVQDFIDYIGMDQFLDANYEPELNNFSFQTLYVHRMPIGEHIKPIGYVHQHGKVLSFFRDLVSQMKHYSVHLVVWLRSESRVMELHHVGVPNTAEWQPQGAMFLHLVKSRIIEEGWDELPKDDRSKLNDLFSCSVFV